MLFFYCTLLDTDDDKDQFSELYLKHRQDMYAVAYSILHNREDAEDAVHDSFISIANNFKKIKQIPCQEVKRYFVIIVRNASINIYNKNKRNSENCESYDDNQISVEMDFFEKFNHQQLVKSISELPMIYKDIVYLYYFKEMTAKEIAKMLRITPETVWKRVERAKHMLKEQLVKGDLNE
jgi:RNA polymerase sigma-70 factor (ECF subfamily)